MDIEHVKCLSWFRGSGESHVQDGERLMRAATLCKVLRPASASSDPAMALEPSCARDGTMIGPSLKSAAASLPDGLGGWPGIRFMERAMTPRANYVSGEFPAARSTTCTEPD